LLDGRDVEGARQAQGTHHQAVGPGLARARQDPPPIHSGDHLGHQCGTGGGAGRTRAHLQGAKAGLVYQQGPL
jgi:hypothetical protein